jgi:RND family efflux transporter MFP subunit
MPRQDHNPSRSAPLATHPRTSARRGHGRKHIGAALLCSGLLAGCAEAASEPAESRQVFAVASPTPSDAAYDREYVGEVRAVRYAEVRSRLKGFIEAVAVDEGQSVKAEQLLFSIGASELQQEVLKARAATRRAQAELQLAGLERDNTQMLFDKKVVSNAEMALADSKIESLKAQLEESKASESQAGINLTYAKVRAPFDGVVNRVPHKAGSVVGEEDLLTTLTDTSSVYVYFRVSEREYLEYTSVPPAERPKQVSLKLADGSVYPTPGTIDAVESEFSKETGNLAFRARFANPDSTLKHGSSGKVVITTKVRSALLVPQKSTFEVQGHLYVYALDTENKARAREIVSKQRLKDSFIVASGLEPQDRFVVEGVQKVKEGERIDTVPAI